MSEPARRRRTFEELYDEIARLPEGLTGEILEPGTLRTMARPGRAHRRAAKWCLESLRGFDRTLGGAGWWIEVEAEIRLPGDRLAVPDLPAWRVERVPELPDENPITILPDWCCEVLSARTARDDRGVKLPMYARSGIAWVWLVDPVIRIVEVYETVGNRPTLAVSAGDEETVTLPPFGGAVDLSPWWSPPHDEPDDGG
jgi:Uma2 family endonuclease